MKTAQTVQHSPIFNHFVRMSVMPSIVLVLTKTITMIFFSSLYNLTYTIGPSGILFNSFESFKMANDFSSAFTFLVAFSFTSWLVFKGYFLHQSHIKPSLSAWVYSQNLENLLVKNMDLFVKLAAWVIFMWIITILIINHYFLGLASDWVLYFSLIMSSVLTVLSIIDIEKEHAIFVSVS